MKELEITQELSRQRLDKFLKKYFPAAGSSFLYKMMRKKNITLNGNKSSGKELLEIGDKIQIFMKDETIALFRGTPSETGKETAGADAPPVSEKVRNLLEEGQKALQVLGDIEVLYEDDHILLLHKPAGVLTQKADSGTLSVNEWILGYLMGNGSITQETLSLFRPAVCNRLDRNTSGIVICGKSLHGSQEMSRLLKSREMHKFYRLAVEGRLERDGEINGFLRKDPAKNQVKIVSHPEQGAAPVRTRYHVLSYLAGADATLIEAQLITGKSHQLRAHFSSIGYPIIGDLKYGDPKKNEKRRREYGIRHQMLHGYRIVFPEVTGEFAYLNGKVFTAPCPAEYERLSRG